MSDLMTVHELARESGFPEKTLYSFLAPAGDLPCIRTQLGPGPKRRTRGHIRIRRIDWEAWLERHRSGPVESATNRPGLRLAGADRYAAG